MQGFTAGGGGGGFGGVAGGRGFGAAAGAGGFGAAPAGGAPSMFFGAALGQVRDAAACSWGTLVVMRASILLFQQPVACASPLG